MKQKTDPAAAETGQTTDSPVVSPAATCFPYARLSALYGEAATIYAQGKHYGAAQRAQSLADAYKLVGESLAQYFPEKLTKEYFG